MSYSHLCLGVDNGLEDFTRFHAKDGFRQSVAVRFCVGPFVGLYVLRVAIIGS